MECLLRFVECGDIGRKFFVVGVDFGSHFGYFLVGRVLKSGNAFVCGLGMLSQGFVDKCLYVGVDV